MSQILVTGATGDTGSRVVPLLLTKGHKVRAMAHREDARTDALRAQGAEVVLGDFSDLDQLTSAGKDIERAYFCYPLRPGIIQATGYFAQVAKENNFEAIVNMSQISARRETGSHAAQDHWIAEQVFNWSGVSTTHVRPTFFAEWLIYAAASVASGLLVLPFSGRHAPIAAQDQAQVIANILDDPAEHAGKVYPLYGPIELTQEEIADEVGRALGRTVTYQNVPFDAFIDAWFNSNRKIKPVHSAGGSSGESTESVKARAAQEFLYNHLEHVAIDHNNGVFSGTNNVVKDIGGVPGTTVYDFMKQNIEVFKRFEAQTTSSR